MKFGSELLSNAKVRNPKVCIENFGSKNANGIQQRTTTVTDSGFLLKEFERTAVLIESFLPLFRSVCPPPNFLANTTVFVRERASRNLRGAHNRKVSFESLPTLVREKREECHC